MPDLGLDTPGHRRCGHSGQPTLAPTPEPYPGSGTGPNGRVRDHAGPGEGARGPGYESGRRQPISRAGDDRQRQTRLRHRGDGHPDRRELVGRRGGPRLRQRHDWEDVEPLCASRVGGTAGRRCLGAPVSAQACAARWVRSGATRCDLRGSAGPVGRIRPRTNVSKSVSEDSDPDRIAASDFVTGVAPQDSGAMGDRTGSGVSMPPMGPARWGPAAPEG
jgi:hypothetical protein